MGLGLCAACLLHATCALTQQCNVLQQSSEHPKAVDCSPLSQLSSLLFPLLPSLLPTLPSASAPSLLPSFAPPLCLFPCHLAILRVFFFRGLQRRKKIAYVTGGGEIRLAAKAAQTVRERQRECGGRRHMWQRVGGAREMKLFVACVGAVAVAVACLQCAPNVNKIFARLP